MGEVTDVNPWEISIWELTLRLSLAVVFGGIIGLERERSNRAAGFRTNILVCVGSTLIMLLSMYGFAGFAHAEGVRMDPARLAAQVISGIGFLGAGVILFNGLSITGLTTAATLWVVAAIGLTVGAGFYYAAGMTTVFVLFSLLVLNKFERRWIRATKTMDMEIAMEESDLVLGQVMNTMERFQVETTVFSFKRSDEEHRERRIVIKLSLKLTRAHAQDLTEELMKVKGVNEILVE